MVKENDKKSWGSGGFFQNRALGSLFLMLATPIFCLTFWYTCYQHQGDYMALISEFKEQGAMNVVKRIVPYPNDVNVWKGIGAYMLFELLVMRLMPGKEFRATVTPSGHIPIYKANGFQSYLFSIAALLFGHYYGYIDAGLIYDNMGMFLSSMNIFAIFFCMFLAFKGLTFPSTKDSGSSGNLIVDFFWGTELYPRVLGWDIKQFTNCRFGMMYWQLGIICYAIKQYQDLGYVSSSMLVSVLVQSVYIAKFFWWETGYFCSMDIQHDRAGYYICWGCMVWVPSMYTMHTYYLVKHPVMLSLPITALFIAAGVFSIWCNYDCDRQRQEFRNTNGRAKIWGREPVKIDAKYMTKDGEERSSILLASGWWGLARHFHYLPEVTASFFWCVPALFENPLPYFYPVYLSLLLLDRAFRDDKRCADKYGKYWDMYCDKVPYKILPGVV